MHNRLNRKVIKKVKVWWKNKDKLKRINKAKNWFFENIFKNRQTYGKINHEKYTMGFLEHRACICSD